MDAVSGDPEYRSAFERERCANGEEIFHPLGSLESAMREQPVISHTDAPSERDPPQEQRYKKYFPAKEKQRGHCANMKEGHEDRGDPVNALRGLFPVHFH